jgi:hypothetical protein
MKKDSVRVSKPTMRSLVVALALASVGVDGSQRVVAATDPLPCGQALERFQGSLCGPASNPCVVRRNEVIPDSRGFRNDGPDLAIDRHDEAHILYPLAESGFYGFLVRAADGMPFGVEAIEPAMAVGAIAFDPDDRLYAMLNDGYASRLWRADGDWELLYRSIPSIRAGRPGSLRRDDVGCLHVGATIDDAPAYLRRATGNTWTFDALTTETGSEPLVALAPSGQPHLAYFTTGGDDSAELFWTAPPSAPEPILLINIRGEQRYPAALAVTGENGDTLGTPHILALQYSSDHERAAVVHAARRADGTWQVQTLAEESALDPYGQGICPTCAAVPEENESCTCTYAAVRPLAIVTNDADDLRLLYARYDVALDLRGYCNARPQIVCEWTGSRTVAGSVVLAWPTAAGMAQQTVVDGILPGAAAAALDSRGRIHLALTDRSEIRYALLEGAATEACPTDCRLDGAVSIDELLTGIRIALGTAALDECAAADSDLDGRVGVDDLLRGVNSALGGCQRTSVPPARYALDGTLNGAPASGTMVLRALSTVEPNVVRYEVVSFDFSALNGSGTAEFFTLNNSFTLNVTVGFPEQEHVALHGGASILATGPLAFSQFHLTADGYDLTFLARADVDDPPGRTHVGGRIGAADDRH